MPSCRPGRRYKRSPKQPAIQLAQQIAEQLHAYAFDGEDFSIGEGEDMRRYRVREFNWKSGVRGRRSKHQAVVLMRVIDHPEIRHAYDDLRLLWDPRTTGVSWDLDSPPHVTELEWATVRYGRDVTLADGRMLAQWAKDALPLLELVRERERQHHADLQEGLAASAVALNQLAV